MIKKIQFTRSGFEKTKNDLDVLTEKRKTAVVNLQTAREHGDLSENGAYKAARFELVNIDRELRRFKYLLRFGEVVETKNDKSAADFGSIVTLKSKDRQMTFTIVGPYESSPSKNQLSIASPIGKAILGHKKGDKIFVLTPNGKTEYKVIKIE